MEAGSTHLITEGKKYGGKHAGITYPEGSVIQRFEYAAFGHETFALNPNQEFNPGYTGQKYDIETGLYWYRSRYYNPIVARFMQPDTIIPDPTDPQSYNRYTYVANNPLKYTDPSGHAFGDKLSDGSTDLGEIAVTAEEDVGTWPMVILLDQDGNGPAPENTADPRDRDYYDGGVVNQVVGGVRSAASYAGNAIAGAAGQVANNIATSIAYGPAQVLGAIDAGITQLTGCDAWCQVATGQAMGPTVIGLAFEGLGGLRYGLGMLGRVGRVGNLARGARFAPIEFTKAGERFVRVGESFSDLKFTFDKTGGVAPRTYAFPEEVFLKIGGNPSKLKDFGDLPGVGPKIYRIIEPPPGTPIQRGVVPGGEHGGSGGVGEVFFPEGF